MRNGNHSDGKTGGRHAPRKLKTAERRAAAWAMRREENAGFQAIADRLGYSVSQAHRDIAAVAREAAERLTDRAEESMIADLDRLDRLEAAQLPNALGGDATACGAVLKCMERRARLLGYDKTGPAVAVAVTVPEPARPKADIDLLTRNIAIAMHELKHGIEERPPHGAGGEHERN